MPRQTIVGLGEVLWDVFPTGPRFGGAPANFACTVAELAGDRADVYMASSVGGDILGQRAIDALERHGVKTGYVARVKQATGRVVVELDDQGRGSYTFDANSAWDNLAWSDELGELARRADAVCFGTLGQRSDVSRATIQRFVRATSRNGLRVLDVNLRPPHFCRKTVLESLALANVLKLNDDELPVLAEMLAIDGAERDLLAELARFFSLRCVALTRGAAGAFLLDAAGGSSELPAPSTTIADTVGAGDAFTAALVLGLLEGRPLAEINAWANRVASYVCSQPGAAPHFPEELRNA